MANLQADSKGNFSVFFRWRGKPFCRSLKTKDLREAETRLAEIETLLYRLGAGLLTVPDDADIASFVVSGGRLSTQPGKIEEKTDESITLGRLFALYQGSVKDRANTGRTKKIHMGHLARIIGDEKRLPDLQLKDVQAYADRRLAEMHGKRLIRPYTVGNEIKTLRHVLTWAVRLKHSSAPITWEVGDVNLPPDPGKERFRTSKEILQRIERGGLKEDEIKRLWSSLYLTRGQLDECLALVRDNALELWVYPMVAIAALTGARRSEIIRAEVDDFDLKNGHWDVRELKRDTEKEFTIRMVPLHPLLNQILESWLNVHPGGRWMITKDGRQLKVDDADTHLAIALRGHEVFLHVTWHKFRHSVCSIMASQGIDQRKIDAIVGHVDERTAARYRHLCPMTNLDAVKSLLG